MQRGHKDPNNVPGHPPDRGLSNYRRQLLSRISQGSIFLGLNSLKSCSISLTAIEGPSSDAGGTTFQSLGDQAFKEHVLDVKPVLIQTSTPADTREVL